MTSNAQALIPITINALVQRLKRRHAGEGESFHATRSRWLAECGRWHLVDAHNFCTGIWRDIESLADHARELGVLHASELVTWSHAA